MAEPILTKLSGYASGLVPHVYGEKNYEKVNPQRIEYRRLFVQLSSNINWRLRELEVELCETLESKPREASLDMPHA